MFKGTLKTLYDGVRPNHYSPMKKQGAIILGIGGDNSDWVRKCDRKCFFVRCFFLGFWIRLHYCCDLKDVAFPHASNPSTHHALSHTHTLSLSHKHTHTCPFTFQFMLTTEPSLHIPVTYIFFFYCYLLLLLLLVGYRYLLRGSDDKRLLYRCC